MTNIGQVASRRVASTATAGRAIGRRSFAAGALALASAPWAARAQTSGKTFRIAIWHDVMPVDGVAGDGWPPWRAFFHVLGRLGLVEGRNLVVERYSSERRLDRNEIIARQIVAGKPDLIIPGGTTRAIFLSALTTAIPIVVLGMSDPVASGLVPSLARPGGNLTGFTLDGDPVIASTRLQMISSFAPTGARLGLVTGRDPIPDQTLSLLRRAAIRLGVELVIESVADPFDATACRLALGGLVRRRVQGLCVGAANEFVAAAKSIVEFFDETGLPAIYANRHFVDDGGLISYGPDITESHRRAAGYVVRILEGEKPGNLPVQRPAMLECVVNLGTAKALGLTLPAAIMSRATKVNA